MVCQVSIQDFWDKRDRNFPGHFKINFEREWGSLDVADHLSWLWYVVNV